MEIKRSHIKYLHKMRADDIGDLFTYQGRILRGILPDKSKNILQMFNDGFLEELIKKKLFIESWVSDVKIDGYYLVIEQRKIEPVIYPQEWTFEMLKDSALVVLKIAKIAKKYGYNMKDCHGLNVLIENNKPKYINLGSFHKNKVGITGWEAFKEFIKFYYFPLYAWSKGLNCASKASISSTSLTPRIEHYIFKYKFFRLLIKFLPIKLSENLIKLIFLPSTIASLSDEKIEYVFKKQGIKSIGKILKKIINRRELALSQNIQRIEKKINKLNKSKRFSEWAEYYSKNTKKGQRFDRIVQLINEYFPDAKSAIDIAGNRGRFSKKVLSESPIEKMICQDLDENTIDFGYKKNKDSKNNISFVNYNAIAPIVNTTHQLPFKRFKSDLVISLALLHHLLLSQGFSIEDILIELKKYTKKYICIEFMPRGLWTVKKGDNYKVPEWYNLEWFKIEFEKQFRILHYEQIETNHVVFLGIIK
jgi:hypothetical protein